MDNPSNNETLMKHYGILIDAYKYHLDLVLKVDAFYYAIAGAIVSYYLSQPNNGYMRLALALPILMGLLLAAFAFFAAYWVNPLGHELDRVKDLLGFEAIPSVTFLKLLLYLSGIFFLIVATGLVVLTMVRP
jgi:hypothetical protein